MYNGYTNYETWRVQLEVLNGMDFDYILTPETLKDITEYIVFSGGDDDRKLCTDFTNNFLDKVNYHELANLINEKALDEVASKIKAEIRDHVYDLAVDILLESGPFNITCDECVEYAHEILEKVIK